MKYYTRLFTSVLCLSFVSCSIFLPSSDKKPTKDKNLQVQFSTSGWSPTDPRESDKAWVQENRGDVIIVNSFCGEFQSLPLEELALKTFKDYDSYKPLGKNHLTWLDREAFEMEAEAYVDGVKVLIHLRNYRRDHCYYDFLLISPRSRTQDSLLAFQKMIDGVSFK
ncbi:MAG: hypothetical protein K2P81_02260 [Bacteriovoracaceae bacterium]|nr:hypothetical protein [Bacteriovoracaceae bacterium]